VYPEIVIYFVQQRILIVIPRSSAAAGTNHMRTATSVEHGVMRCPAALLRLGASFTLPEPELRKMGLVSLTSLLNEPISCKGKSQTKAAYGKSVRAARFARSSSYE